MGRVATIGVSAPYASGVRAVALRAAAGTGGALVLAAVRIHRPATFCPFRAVTGVPCPICGTTTAMVRLGRGNVAGALAANPVTLLALAALVLAPVLAGRVRLPQRAAPWLLTCVVAFAWMWQLVRFDRVPF
jgi:hypothetical protein